jgi:hypothetical protein
MGAPHEYGQGVSESLACGGPPPGLGLSLRGAAAATAARTSCSGCPCHTDWEDGGAEEPQVGFGAPAAAVLVGAESLRLPVNAVDVRVIDRAMEGGLEGGHANWVHVLAQGHPDGLGDEGIIQDGVKV